MLQCQHLDASARCHYLEEEAVPKTSGAEFLKDKLITPANQKNASMSLPTEYLVHCNTC